MGNSVIEQIIAVVFADTALNAITGFTHAVGRREAGVHAKPPRVVAIPTGAPVIDQPDRPGDAKYSDQGRILLIRRFRIEWECHGAPATDVVDFAPAENLFLATIRAVRKATHHSVVFENEEWKDQEEGGDGFDKHGSLIKFVSTINIPIYEPRTSAPLATVATIETKLTLPNNLPSDAEVIDE